MCVMVASITSIFQELSMKENGMRGRDGARVFSMTDVAMLCMMVSGWNTSSWRREL